MAATAAALRAAAAAAAASGAAAAAPGSGGGKSDPFFVSPPHLSLIYTWTLGGKGGPLDVAPFYGRCVFSLSIFICDKDNKGIIFHFLQMYIAAAFNTTH